MSAVRLPANDNKRPDLNQSLIDRIKGVPAQPSSPDDKTNPQNPCRDLPA